jgi:diguanylate cyclase
VLSLGRALGLKTTAEGLESEEARQLLLKLGCDTGQGFLFGRPEPAAVVTEALRVETTALKAGGASFRPRQIA